jgi:hypothetical protein
MIGHQSLSLELRLRPTYWRNMGCQSWSYGEEFSYILFGNDACPCYCFDLKLWYEQ